MSLFRVVCNSRSVKLHAALWLLSIALLVMIFTGTVGSLLAAGGIGSAAAQPSVGEARAPVFAGAPAAGAEGGGGGRRSKCQVTANIGDVFAVSQCKAEEEAAGEGARPDDGGAAQAPPPPAGDSSYEVHVRVPRLLPPWLLEWVFAPSNVVAWVAAASWKALAVVVGVVFAAALMAAKA